MIWINTSHFEVSTVREKALKSNHSLTPYEVYRDQRTTHILDCKFCPGRDKGYHMVLQQAQVKLRLHGTRQAARLRRDSRAANIET